MATLERYYEILGITPSSTLLEINQAYIRAINALLPARSSVDPGVQAKAQSRAKDINDAYERIKIDRSADAHVRTPVRTAAPPPPPLLRTPEPPPFDNAQINTKAAYRAALEKAAADKAESDRAEEEQILAGKAAAAIARADATAAAISAAIATARDPDSQARAEAARRAAERDAVERIAAAKAAAAKAAAARAEQERNAAVARMTAWAVQGFLLASLCVATYLVYTKAVLPLVSARTSVSGAIIPRRSPPHSPAPGREAKLASAVSQPPDVKLAATNDVEMPREIVITPAAVTPPDRGRSPMNVTAIRRAAENGDADAQGELGDLYETGNGVIQDYGAAAGWYLKGAERGNAEAQKKLADLYAEGKGVARDLREAVKWYRRAANKGNAEAQAALEIWNSQ